MPISAYTTRRPGPQSGAAHDGNVWVVRGLLNRAGRGNRRETGRPAHATPPPPNDVARRRVFRQVLVIASPAPCCRAPDRFRRSSWRWRLAVVGVAGPSLAFERVAEGDRNTQIATGTVTSFSDETGFRVHLARRRVAGYQCRWRSIPTARDGSDPRLLASASPRSSCVLSLRSDT